jgi:hypothetical protein
VERPYSYILYNQSQERTCRRIPPHGNLSELDKIRAKTSNLIFLDVVNSVDGLIRDKMYMKQKFVEAVTVSDEKLIEMGKEDLLRYLR